MEALGSPGRRARDHPRPAREARARTASEVRHLEARPATSSRSPTSSTRSIPTSRGSRSCCRASTRTQTFDLDVVTAQSMENPVYYVQYAHARIASIGRQGRRARASTRRPIDDVDLAPLVARARARAAARARASIPRCVAEAAELRAPHRVTTWVRDFARALPRLLPRLPGAHRRRRAHPGAALAHRGVPDRPGQRAGDPRRARARRDGARSTTTTTTTTPDDAADAPFDLTLLPRRRGRRRRARRRRRASTSTALADEFGTPLFVYDEDDLRGRCREYVGAFGADARRLRGQGVPLHGDGAARRRRGPRTSTSRPAASCTSRCTAGFPPERDRVPRQQQVRRRARARAATPGVGRIVVDSFDELDRIEALVGDGAAAPRVLVRVTPGRRGAHARVHRDRHRRLEVRLHASSNGAARDAARARRRRATRCELRRASTATSGRRSSVLDSFARAVDDRGRARRRRSTRRPATPVDELNLGGGLGVPLPRRRPDAPTIARVRARRARRVRQGAARDAGLDRRAAARRSSRAARSRRRPASRSTASARSRRSPACAPTSRSTAG